MPDALSKTVPIWICVLNRLLFPEQTDCHELQTPREVVSESEHSQIEQRLSSFVQDVKNLDLDVKALRSKLAGKPLQPLWVTPATDIDSAVNATNEAFHTIVLCTASSRASTTTHDSSTYVQGAADDSESWALGLDAATFWSHNDRLLSTSEDELPAVIASLMKECQAQGALRNPILVKPTRNIWIADNAAAETVHADFDVIVSCSPQPNCTLSDKLKSLYIHLSCSTGKVGSRQLRFQLPELERLRSLLKPESKVLVTCDSGKDLAVGVALTIICRFCNEDGSLRLFLDQEPAALSKTTIKHRLSWVMISMPDASPSRATLQSVNAYLLG